MGTEGKEPEPQEAAAELTPADPTPTEQEAFDAGFDEEPEKETHPTAAEKAAADKAAAEKKPDEPDKKPEATEAGALGAGEKKDTDEDAGEDAPEKGLAALAEKYKDGGGGEQKPSPPPAPEPKKEVVPGSLTERLSKALDRESDEFAGQKVNVKEFEEDFREEAAYVKSTILAAVAPILKEIEDKAAEMNELRYWSAIQDSHPGAKKIAASKEFNDWLDKQPEPIRRASLTLNATDAITILDAYQATVRKSAKESAKQEAAAAKAKKDALHGGTLRGSGTKAKTTKTENEDDFGAAFDEATG